MRLLATILLIGIAALSAVSSSDPASAHSGNTDGSGGHNCYVGSCAGSYHHHGGAGSIGSTGSGGLTGTSNPGGLLWTPQVVKELSAMGFTYEEMMCIKSQNWSGMTDRGFQDALKGCAPNWYESNISLSSGSASVGSSSSLDSGSSSSTSGSTSATFKTGPSSGRSENNGTPPTALIVVALIVLGVLGLSVALGSQEKLMLKFNQFTAAAISPEMRNLSGRVLVNKDFSTLDLSNTSFDKANVANANFKLAILQDSTFRNAFASDANFVEADLEGTDFTGADLRRVNFAEAILDNVNFSEADLFGASFRGASWSNETKWPAEFEPPKQQMVRNLDAEETQVEDLELSNLLKVGQKEVKNIEEIALLFECGDCGAGISNDATECASCGATFDEEGFECPDCGATIPETSASCPSCGEEFQTLT